MLIIWVCAGHCGKTLNVLDLEIGGPLWKLAECKLTLNHIGLYCDVCENLGAETKTVEDRFFCIFSRCGIILEEVDPADG